MEPLFQDREAAGKYLATKLTGYVSQPEVIILALPRGGVPVGFEVSQGSMPRWTFSSCANWVCRGTKSWRWARLRRAAPVC